MPSKSYLPSPRVLLFFLINFKTKVVEGRHSIAGTAEKVALIFAFKLDVLVPTELL